MDGPAGVTEFLGVRKKTHMLVELGAELNNWNSYTWLVGT